MIFGEESRFAVEIVGDDPGFCACLLWVDGVRLGDEGWRDLPSVAAEGLDHFRHLQQTWQPNRLFGREGRALLAEVFEGMFGEAECPSDVERPSGRYGPLLLSPNLCSSLDHCVVVVAKLGPSSKVIAGDLKGVFLTETVVPTEIVDGILSEVVDELRSRLPARSQRPVDAVNLSTPVEPLVPDPGAE